jgi:hypothetical protein
VAQIGLALENALRTGEFKLNVEVLRQRCIDEKSYDKINFITILKGRKDYFKESTYNGDLTLSPEGKTALADTLEELKAQDKMKSLNEWNKLQVKFISGHQYFTKLQVTNRS